ncbi:MAG TPA: 2-C-methyl-D-erythritol 4-phosphate cytidylyltransferase [Dehalococcoidia bacterium]|nr:2-C-methyl-D-erythritol 4-phosphate cytidylyltransferase [Dehalococcoidia bacterium]
MQRVGVIVAAAGIASRMDGIEKLFADLGGKPVLAWCIDTFESLQCVDRIVVALNQRNMTAGRALAVARDWRKCRFCLGGARRQDSVRAALSLLDDVDSVVVHDGDRPFVTVRMIQDGMALLDEVEVAVTAVPLKDTVKVVDERCNVLRTLVRNRLRLVQTPQLLRMDVIRSVYGDVAEDATDDAMLAERRGFRVKVYDGAYENIKITTPEDLVVARSIAQRWRASS